jgi:uncharacterized protein YneF (UPF0154 family)
VKLSRWILLGFVVLVIMIILAIAQIVLKFTYQDLIYSNLFLFIFSLIAIAILSIVGSVFIGMYISASYFSARNFTPFEEEMLKMRKEVGEVKEKLDQLDDKLKEQKH